MELIVATCWAIWHERNLFIFENKKEDSQLSAAKAEAVVHSYKKIQLPPLQTSLEKKSIATSNWQSPLPGYFKVNVDASVVVEQRRVGLGAVIRDARGKVIAAAMKPSCFQQEVAYAEAEAARFGVEIAEKVGSWPLIIETDSQEVVDLVLNKKSTRTELYWVISDLQACIKRQQQISIQYTPRASNVIAHNLARLALEQSDVVLWVDNIPARQLYLFDC